MRGPRQVLRAWSNVVRIRDTRRDPKKDPKDLSEHFNFEEEVEEDSIEVHVALGDVVVLQGG